MKKLIVLVSMLSAFSVQAERWNTDAKFEICKSGDMNTLRAATVRGNAAVLNLVKTDVLENETSCVVKKPRFIHPAVCGTSISQIDTYIINTETEATYTIVVDSSYRSCLRYRVIPMIKSLKYEPTPRVIPFNN